MVLDLQECRICPRNCAVNRNELSGGYCNSGAGFYIASIFPHLGEEPVISGDRGICNVFFAHCNLQCVYCQNYQISKNSVSLSKFEMSKDEVIERITSCLDNGIKILGFVSPSHFVVQMIEIIEILHKKGYFPTVVYNTNAYDNVETLKEIEKYVDVYLPDFKYAFSDLSRKYSKSADYPQIAIAAIKEMYRQKGDFLYVNNNGYVESGLIIRHLILPNNIENSLEVLELIAKELSPKVYISLMSQYYPTAESLKYPELSRTLTREEYEIVVNKAKSLGLTKGWIQEMSSSSYYQPDFERKKPFR